MFRAQQETPQTGKEKLYHSGDLNYTQEKGVYRVDLGVTSLEEGQHSSSYPVLYVRPEQECSQAPRIGIEGALWLLHKLWPHQLF